jgi:hypothetical protein
MKIELTPEQCKQLLFEMTDAVRNDPRTLETLVLRLFARNDRVYAAPILAKVIRQIDKECLLPKGTTPQAIKEMS